MRHARLAALAVSVVLATAACSGASTPTTASAPSVAASAASAASGASSAASGVSSAAAGSAVSIANFAFAPAAITVAVGTTVTWTNSDSAGHTVTADDGSFKSDRLGTGATFSETFATAGTFAYHCSIHKSMTGTITVH